MEKTILPIRIFESPHGNIGVAPVTLPEHRSEFWYVATMNATGEWVTRSVMRVNHNIGQDLEREVRAWAAITMQKQAR